MVPGFGGAGGSSVFPLPAPVDPVHAGSSGKCWGCAWEVEGSAGAAPAPLLGGAAPAPLLLLSLHSSRVGMWEAELESIQLVERTFHRQNIDCGEFGVQHLRVEMLIWCHLLNFTHIPPLSCYYYNFLMPINFPFPLTSLRGPQLPSLLPLGMTDRVSQNNMTKLNLSLL